MTLERVRWWATSHPRLIATLSLVTLFLLAADPAAAGESTIEFTDGGTWLTDGGP